MNQLDDAKIRTAVDRDTGKKIRIHPSVVARSLSANLEADAAGLQFSSMAQVDEGQPVCLLGLSFHILVAGATFNLHTRKASAGALMVPKE